MEGKISIIIPVYNREQYIEECIASVHAQSYQNYEIILIDDGSTDSTFEICQGLAQNDPRIILLSTEHVGVSAARNIGLSKTTGKYVFFLDSDDVIHCRLLEVLVKAMEETGAQMGGSFVLNISQSCWASKIEQLKNADDDGLTTYQDHLKTLSAVFGGSTPLGMIGGVMMRRDLIGQTRFRTDLTIGEDFYFIYENLIKGASSVFLKPKWYFGRIHKNNTSWDYGYTGFLTRFLRRKLVADSEEAFGRTENAKRQRREAFATYLWCLSRNKKHCADVRKMRKTLRGHKKELFTAFDWKYKLIYYLSVYLPATYCVAMKLWKKLRAKV